MNRVEKLFAILDHSSVGIRESQTDKETWRRSSIILEQERNLTTYFQLKSAPNWTMLSFSKKQRRS